MQNVQIVFDDTGEKSEIIQDVIGKRGFGDIVIKRERLEKRFSNSLRKIYPDARWHTVRSVFEFQDLRNIFDLELYEDTRVLYCFSNYVIWDEAKALLAYEKLKYIDGNYKVLSNGCPAALMFQSLSSFQYFLKQICGGELSSEAIGHLTDSFDIEGLVDIGQIGNFIQCITGNFDSRFFNSLKGDDYEIVKASTNKKKIKAEYQYYHLLPDNMKYWFVMPFDYSENEDSASYRMERLHMTDLSIKWVHGSILPDEFSQLMDTYFTFFRRRHKKEVSSTEYQKMQKTLYEHKVIERIRQFQSLPEYETIASFVAAGCPEQSLDHLLQKYLDLKEKLEGTHVFENIQVIGHGDPCFSNAMYNKSTRILKFIDPKGALSEDELWTDPYYDIAKLSHSVCGYYDFFNNALFDIKINESLSYELCIDFDNSRYKEILKEKLEENGYDYLLVRLYEASLFLSMLPLHIDYPQKVFGFILNAKNILEEIEHDLQ